MKLQKSAFAIIMTALLFAGAYSLAGKSEKSSSSPATEEVKAFLGRWDLTLKAPDREYPSWLELREKGGQLQARMVGRWGHVRLLPKVALLNGHLTFVSPKEEEDRPDDMVFEGTLVGEKLAGTLNGLNGVTWQWTGQPAPALKPGGAAKWGKPIQLFNGKDLTGWKTSGPSKNVWKVENGNLLSPGNGPELISESKFEDFKLHIEFNCGENSNSGVYLRGRYEVQLETDSSNEPPDQRMGGVYGFLAASPEQPRKVGEWQNYDITLIGRWITVMQNGKTIIDNKEIPGITGGALDSHEELPGPIYLQGTENGHVIFRNIVITPAEK